MHNLAYVRTSPSLGSLEVRAGNVTKAQSLFTEFVEATMKVISSFFVVHHCICQLWSTCSYDQ
jgi:hypothetical protein